MEIQGADQFMGWLIGDVDDYFIDIFIRCLFG